MNAQLVILPAASQRARPASAPRALSLHLPVIIGRSEEADVRIGDRWVSRLHCRIELRKGMLFVTDLGSKHGTWVNHRRVEESIVFPGDELEIGLTTFRAVYEVDSCPLLS